MTSARLYHVAARRTRFGDPRDQATEARLRAAAGALMASTAKAAPQLAQLDQVLHRHGGLALAASGARGVDPHGRHPDPATPRDVRRQAVAHHRRLLRPAAEPLERYLE